MFSHATKTVRVAGIPLGVEHTEFNDTVARLSARTRKKALFSSSSASLNSQSKLLTSLSPQFEDQVGTITLPSTKHKRQALKNHGTDWDFDDIFDGITVLYSALKPNLE